MILLPEKRDEAERKAWDSLARYKFMMFGYWASIWVHLNQLCPDSQPNPFAHLVKIAMVEAIRLEKGSGGETSGNM